jgi:hypothetical protein
MLDISKSPLRIFQFNAFGVVLGGDDYDNDYYDEAVNADALTSDQAAPAVY